MKIVDLSVLVDDGNPSEEVSTKINYISHRKGAIFLGLSALFSRNKRIKNQLPQIIKRLMSIKILNQNSFCNHQGLSTEFVKLTSHTGTHIDSPYHYTIEGEKISEVSLDLFYKEGVLLNFSNRKLRSPIQLFEVIRYIEGNNIELNENKIVIFFTGADKYYGSKEYRTHYFGISLDVIKYLLTCGVKVVGTDAFSLDQPFDYMVSNYQNSKNSKELWPIHMMGSKEPFFMIEKLSSLEVLADVKKFTVIAFPIKLKDASASWPRVAAIIE